MNWQHLVYFRAIVENDSFSKTAEKLYITPSALSKSVHSLEEEMGIPLFEKRGRVSVLTKFGLEFYSYVCQAIDAIEKGTVEIKKEMQEWKGHVDVAGIYTISVGFLPPLLKDFRELYPNITFTVSYDVSGEVIKRLIDHEIDIGIIGDFDLKDQRIREIEYRKINCEDLVVIVPKNHPLAKEEFVDFNKLKNDRFIFWKKANSGLNSFVLDICHQYGLNDECELEAYDDPTLLSMVESGLGIGLVPDLPYLRKFEISVLKFKEDSPHRTLHLVWRKKGILSSVAALFRDYILDGVPPELNQEDTIE